MEVIVVAIIIGVIGPTVTAVLGWRRQDAVAAQAKRDAREAASAAREVARLLAESNSRSAEDASEIKGQLTAIHAFVNSEMTAALQAQLIALEGQLVLLIASRDVSSGTQAVMDAIDTKIAELKGTLVDRKKAQAIADAAALKARSAVAAIDAVTEAQAISIPDVSEQSK